MISAASGPIASCTTSTGNPEPNGPGKDGLATPVAFAVDTRADQRRSAS